ncbi:Iduronate 2-sulfatase [Portunus trituberculatus]|uniref:Iduronate 2-sulfatase n=1 Tax=Portunus trituberculatus TaxID=210409 RepID=A0A5B7CYU3_PORTR|nr:Iduronate 2-sulfatase [Portunus trituberculatus]
MWNKDLMENRHSLLAVFALVVTGVCGSDQPNVLLIVVDDLRPVLGCYGDSLAITPNIDALAHDATVFTRAYAQQALCGPSRTSFLTSRRPDTTRLYDVHSYWRRHAGNFTSLPQYFKENGYHTASAGKIFHPGIVSNHSDDQPYSWSETPYHPPTQAHKQDPVCLGPDGSLHTSIYCPVQVEEQPGGSLPDIETTRYSVSWLKKWGREAAAQPFFLAVGYHKPHIPLKFPKQFLDLYPISSVPLAPNRWLPKGLPPVAWNPWNDLRWRADIAALNVSFPYGPMPDFYARYIRQGYYAATSYTDSLIGELLATVNHLFPDTIIAFIGDHGWSLGEHQEWSKFSNFEVSTQVPFIIRNWRRTTHNNTAGHGTYHHPQSFNQPEYSGNGHSAYEHVSSRMGCESVPPKSVKCSKRKAVEYSGLVELVDLFPTLVDLAGLPILPQCPKDSSQVRVCTEGMSLSHVVQRSLQTLNSNTKHNTHRSTNSWDVMTNEILINPSESNKENSIWSIGREHMAETTGVRHRDHTVGRSMPLSVETSKAKPQQMHQKRIDLLETERYFKPATYAEKKAVFSQYPRPGPTPSRNPDSDQPHTRDVTIMGYSIRTHRFRYTAWLKFNNQTYRPDYKHIVAEELYDHKTDPQEDHNVAGKRFYTQHKREVYSMLVRGWREAVRYS